MRLTKLSIDGFGKFTDRDLDLDPGLQVIAGPNERGKSTLRHFITDMLYGQKRSASRRLYDESNELRAPWYSQNGYGGRLTYSLDAGQQIEVQRSFNPDSEYVKVFDRTHAEDITGAFEQLKNREVAFAEQHLHMTKAVFMGVATISHVSLSDLGDRKALIHIREKLLSLADSASEDQSAEKALKWLNDRISAIGQPQARTKPLPVMRQRLTDLQAEYQEAYEAAREIAVYERQRVTVLDAIGALRNRRTELENAIARRERAERADIVRRAEVLERRIDEITSQLFGLSAVREFPAERAAEVERLSTLLQSAAEKLTQSTETLDALTQERDAAIARLEEQGVPFMKEADPELENRLADLDKQIGLVHDRVEQLEQTAARAEETLRAAEETLQGLPDFSQFMPDPVQHFTGLAGTHDLARRTLDEETRRLEQLRARVAEQEASLEQPRERYGDRENFLTDLREYEASMYDSSEATRDRERERSILGQQAEDLVGRFPGFVMMTVGSAVAAAALAIVGYVTGNNGIYISAGILAVMFAFFFGSALINRRHLSRMRTRLTELDADESAEQRGHDAFRDLMETSGCDTLRELEADYDRYREGERTLASLNERVEEQQTEVDEARRRTEEALAALREAFARVGEAADNESDVEGTVSRVLSRYQEYRDGKRRQGEAREAQQRASKELAEARSRLQALRDEDLEVSLEVRQFLRDNHYPEEQNHDSALPALRAYRIKSAQMRQKQSELEVTQGQIKVLRRELDAQQSEHDRLKSALHEELERAGVDSVETFTSKAAEAETYRDLTRERQALQQQLEACVGDHDLDALRKQVEQDEPVTQAPQANVESLKRELTQTNEELEAKRKQEHALQLMIAERNAGQRTLNEVDEERSATEQRVAELELELKAAQYAAEAIDEVTRERHSRIAPKLAERASHFLKEITGGVYDELLVDRDMQISVRIPQTKSMKTDPERRLSKGTVDQIYLALRLAMVQSMSEHAESVPMVLDDPFANYDDERLLCAMKLLAEVGQQNQVLLFTCRQDVVRAAESVGAPLIRL